LEQLVLKLGLRLHYVEVGSLRPLALHLEEEGVIDEVLDRLLIVREVKVRVYEGHAEVEILEKLIYCLLALAHLLGCCIPALEEADLEVPELVRVEVPLQLVVLLLEAVLLGDPVHLHRHLVWVLEVLGATGAIVEWPFHFSLSGASISVFDFNLVDCVVADGGRDSSPHPEGEIETASIASIHG
jgi:hypothetical protein